MIQIGAFKRDERDFTLEIQAIQLHCEVNPELKLWGKKTSSGVNENRSWLLRIYLQYISPSKTTVHCTGNYVEWWWHECRCGYVAAVTKSAGGSAVHNCRLTMALTPIRDCSWFTGLLIISWEANACIPHANCENTLCAAPWEMQCVPL